MAEPRETSVFYKAITDFASLKKELRSVRSELAKTQAAEKAFNAASAKDRAAATKASTTRAKSLAAENANLKAVLGALTRYRDRQKSTTTAVVAANAAIKLQNTFLLTNAKRLSAATIAARQYAAAQRAITKSTGMSGDAIRAQKEFAKAQAAAAKTTRQQTQELKDNASAAHEVQKANVKFVDSVGEVNQATGEVVDGYELVAESSKKAARGTEEAAEKITVARRRELDALGAVRVAELQLAEFRKKYAPGSVQIVRAEERLAAAYRRLQTAQEAVAGSGRALPPILARVERGGNRLYKSLEKFGNWRPRLIPPFVALIPIIGAVVAALNPLVALLGAVGGAAIGLAGQIGSLAGAFVALPGILSGVVAGITSVIASMGGVGNVFKTYSAMQKAVGKSPGNGGETQAERADRLAEAERNLAKTQRNVQKAQENLNKAREEALRDLIDLREEVSRASLTEERAIADLRLAQEAYWNVMADPGSTLGDKLDAAARIKEAEADLEDVRQKNIDNQKALTEAERKGVNQSDKVLDAQEQLTDAYEAQKDAQKALKTETAGGSAAVTAVNEFNAALAALSPSARKFVLALLAMEDQWKAFRLEMQETFFSQFTDDLDRLPRLLDTITRFLRPSAAAMGQFVDKLLDMLDSPAWKRDLATIGDQNAGVINNLGDAFLSLSSFLKDVVVAAGPFTEWLTGGLADGADNMSKLLDTEEERGSFREWLEKVEVRLRRWWEIVKNIGGTIFNYSAAASDFGDWITDGLLEMTRNWLKFSEEARDPNSGFQQWLEDIKPVLEEVDRLLGAFFGWFGREAADPENIESAVNILKILTDEVGPALGRLMDTLAETDIDEKFLTALASIIESVDTILENGGSKAFETFFDIVESFFSGLATAISLIPKPILDGLLSLFGFLAAATFIGKFTGLTNLLGLFLGFTPATAGLWAGLFAKLKGLDKLKFLSLIGKAGLLTILAAGVTANVQSYGDIFGQIAEADKKNKEGKPEEAIGELTKDGTFAKAWLGPIVNLGTISEVIGWFSPEAKAEFDKNLEGLSEQMISKLSEMLVGIDNFKTDVNNTFTLLWDGLQTGFNTFATGWNNGWTIFWGGLGSAVQTAVNTISTIWYGIQLAFQAPVNWVIQNVWNNGIVSFWNNTAGKLGMAKLGTMPLVSAPSVISGPQGGSGSSVGGKPRAFADGGVNSVMPGYTPGSDVHDFYSPTAGRLKLSGGEAIMRPEFTKMMGGKSGIDAINSRVRRGESAFALGGVIGDWGKNGPKKQQTKTTKKPDLGGDIFSGVSKLFTDPASFIGDGLKGLVNPLLAGMSGDGWSGMVKQLPNALIDGMVSAVKSFWSANPAAGGGGGKAIGWQNQWAAVKGAFPGASLNSSVRPGAKTVNGGTSYHASGRAIDVTPSMEIFNWIRQNYPNSRELIYSPAGNRQLQNGQNHFWGEPVRSQHWNHVHWAMKNGGVFDNGGWMNPGQAGFNFSGKPEAVLTNEESLGLKKLLAGTGLSGGLPSASAVAASGLSGQPQVVDNSVNVGTVIMNNPVPEKPSTSLPKAIRQIGYMNLARTGQDA